MSKPPLALEWIPGRYAVCRLAAGAELPAWAEEGTEHLVSVTRTDRELSVVAPEGVVPAGARAERGWVALRVAGTLAFDEIGVLARLSSALAEANVSVFCLSTYETDILLIKSADVPRAVEALGQVADVSKL